ncbi:MAG: SirB1 family protein [Longimicrobiales bacterium]
MSAPARSARHEFGEEVGRADEVMNLGRAALLVAKEEYPQLAVEPYLIRLDVFAEEVRDRLDGETAPPVVLSELIQNLFKRQRLRGNKDHYYDPKNSFLNDVLDRGLGIPLTLGIVVLEVGWRLGLDLEGVSFPHHFLVRSRGESTDLLIDPYYGGKIRFPDEAQELLDQQYGGEVRLQEAHMNRATKRDMIHRLLTNLKGIYLKSEEHEKALAAVERILILHPTATAEIRDRGYLLAGLGRPDEALAQLETYLTFAPNAQDVKQVEMLLKDLRSRSGRL